MLTSWQPREEWQVEYYYTLWQHTKGLFILEFLDFVSFCKFPTLITVIGAGFG